MVGVSPGMYEIDFEPKATYRCAFSFIFDEGIKSDTYIEGDLAKYVTISADELVGSGSVIVTMEFPEQIEIPGEHIIYIGAMQNPGSGGGVGIIGNVRGVIKVRVPYPGKYAVIDMFEINNANQGTLLMQALASATSEKKL